MFPKKSKRPLIITALWLTGVISALEFSLMMLIQQFNLPQFVQAVIGGLLIILAGPIAYYFVTRRMQAEDELTMRPELLDYAGDGVSVMDWDRNLVYVNETFCRIHGYTKEELIGLNIAQLDTRAIGGMEDPVARELEDSGEIVFEVTHLHKDGSEVAFEIHSRVVEMGDSRFIINI
ncbi:MAG: PAS domain S-box protein, partial [Dehalococcoidales bacterium]